MSISSLLKKAVFIRPFLFLMLFGLLSESFAQTPQSNYSIKFWIKNMGISVEGKFETVQGSFEFDPTNYQKAAVHLFLPLTGLNTGNKLRDRHLRSDDYFNAGQWPHIVFKSDSIRPGASSGQWTIFGSLIIKNIEKKLAIPFKLKQTADGNWQAHAEVLLNRRDFEVGGRSLILSDQVKVAAQVVWH